MKQFEISVKTMAGSKAFTVRPTSESEDALYEIWDGSEHLFTLECCIDESGKSLKLTHEYSQKEIYPGLVKALSDVIFKEEKQDLPTRKSA